MLKVTHGVMNETVPHLSTTRDPGGRRPGICRNIFRQTQLCCDVLLLSFVRAPE